MIEAGNEMKWIGMVAGLVVSLVSAPEAAAAPPGGHSESKVCDVFVFTNPPNIGDAVAAVQAELVKKGCKAGDILRLVTQGGLTYNVVPEALCDYRHQIIARQGSGSVSCVYLGPARGWR